MIYLRFFTQHLKEKRDHFRSGFFIIFKQTLLKLKQGMFDVVSKPSILIKQVAMNLFSYKSLAVVSALFFMLILSAFSSKVLAQNGSNINISSDIEAETMDRLSESDAIRFITNNDESVNLIVTETGIAIQFSDQFMKKLEDEINSDDGDTDNSAFAKAIKSMVSSGVSSILDHAILIPFYEIGSVSYTNGRIVITDVDGNEIFEDMEINDKQVMEDFSGRDSRRFVADTEKRLI